jgi:hypothetical protein
LGNSFKVFYFTTHNNKDKYLDSTGQMKYFHATSNKQNKTKQTTMKGEIEVKSGYR